MTKDQEEATGEQTMNKVYLGDNLPILRAIADETIDLIYIDPPFNTRKSQSRTRIRTRRDANGDRKGFGGQTYQTVTLGTQAYPDNFGDDFLDFIRPRLAEAHRILAASGTLYFHIDYREVHHCKRLLDGIFGRECFLNEIIWAYDYGGRSKTRWPAKHDNILVYVKDPANYTFNHEQLAATDWRAPAPGGAQTAAPSDVWWHTIVPTRSKERTGYPTQKPRGILDRIIRTSSNSGDLVLDFFAGSGTTGESCHKLGRRFILIDNNPQAWAVLQKRFAGHEDVTYIDERQP